MLTVLATLGVLATSGVLGAVYARSVQGQLTSRFSSGQGELEAGQAVLKQANNEHKPELVPLAKRHFSAGRADFVAVRDDRFVKQLAPLSGLPVVGPRVAAVGHLAVMGIALADAGTAASNIDALLLAPAPPGEQGQGAKRILTVLNQAKPEIAAARANFESARREAAAVDVSVLPTSQQKAFVHVRGSIDKGIAGLDEFDRLSPVLSDILGVNGPRYYLIEQVNHAELRPGGGYIGTYSVLSADQGVLKLEKSGDTHQLPDFNVLKGQPSYVAPPPTMVEFLGTHSWALQDSNFFPDFPSNAKAGEQFAQRDVGRPVDGVMSIDVVAIAALLQVTGPITVPGIGTVDSANLVDKAEKIDVSNDPNHKSVLFGLMAPLMDRITTLNSAQWPQMLTVLNQLAAQRHLQTYFNRDPVQAEIGRFGWTGDLQTTTQDFMYPVETNFGGNKSNYWLTRTFDLTLTRTGGTLHHHLVVNLTLDRHLFVSQFNAFYRCYFRLYTSDGASNLHIGNVKADDYPNSPPQGLKLVDGWQQINPNARTQIGQLQVTYDWDTPWTADAAGTHRIYWQKQPGTISDKVTVHWGEGSTSTTVTDISQDRVLVLKPGAVAVEPGLVPSAKLPGVSV